MARQNVLEMPEQPTDAPDETLENGEAQPTESSGAITEDSEAEKKTKRPKRSLREVARDEYDAAQERVNKLEQQLTDAKAVLAYKAQNPLLKEETAAE